MVFTITKDNGAVIAAFIAAFASLCTTIIAIRANTRIARIGEFKEERREVRKRMKDLSELMSKAEASVRRLVTLAPTVSPEDFVHETVTTLSTISDYFRATTSNALIDHPKEVAASARSVRNKLTELILSLDMADNRRKAPHASASIKPKLEAIEQAVNECNVAIRKAVNPHSEESDV
ncbi:MAG: hypothetical protein IBJ19_02645 [Gemmatimonadaceae bacterium]|nr:hypothetical protein [Gemmatimonadaceae bacterium]